MDFNEIVQNLLNLSKEIDISDKSHDRTSEKYTITQIYNQKYVGIKRSGHNYLNHATSLFLEKETTILSDKKPKKISAFISFESVQKKLLEITIDALINHSSQKDVIITRNVSNYFSEIKQTEFRFYVGIGNLIVRNEQKFGLITFFANDVDVIKNRFQDQIECHYMGTAFTNLCNIRKQQNICTLAEVKTLTSDMKKCAEMSRLTIRQHLNVLQCFSREGFFLEGEPTRDEYHHNIFDVKGKSFQEAMGSNKRHNYHIPLNLDDFIRDNQNLFEKIDAALKTDSNNPLMQRVIFSLDWLGDSLTEANDHHRLLKLMISLESLLLDSYDSSKRLLLEERAAFLYSKQYEKRIFIKDLINEAYTKRNAIIHTGNKEPLPQDLLQQITIVIRELNIIIISNNNFKTQSNIQKYVENEKYGKNEVISQ